MSEQYLSTTSKTGMHLKKFMFFSNLHRPEKHIAGTRRVTYEKVQQQVVLKSFKTHLLQYMKKSLRKQATQNYENGIWTSEVIKGIFHYNLREK